MHFAYIKITLLLRLQNQIIVPVDALSRGVLCVVVCRALCFCTVRVHAYALSMVILTMVFVGSSDGILNITLRPLHLPSN
jgi:hypothetical protein